MIIFSGKTTPYFSHSQLSEGIHHCSFQCEKKNALNMVGTMAEIITQIALGTFKKWGKCKM